MESGENEPQINADERRFNALFEDRIRLNREVEIKFIKFPAQSAPIQNISYFEIIEL